MAIPFLAPVISYMARTGEGTDACLQEGCLPLPVHFYSPVPDLSDLDQRSIWDKCSNLTGIEFRPDRQEAFLLELGGKFGHECDWPAAPTKHPDQFYTENSSFSFGCAAALHCILREYKPMRVIEIGSGFSSQVISEALIRNAEDSRTNVEYTIIDPYPKKEVEFHLQGITRLLKQRVELLDELFFEQLQENDVLFVDSGHTVRIGSDVNFLILDVLPRLAPGVIIHFHDINLPREYPRVYATNPSFRMYWTEAYLLQAFLSLNSHFEILLAMTYLMKDKRESFLKAFPLYEPTQHKLTSGSFWIKRVK